jgi:DNA invertase Pin-like site-specific DNA recombinase
MAAGGPGRLGSAPVPPRKPARASPTAYSYLRFSTPEQAKGDSLRRQAALAEAYAKRHGLTLDTELNLKDLGVSAFRGDNVGTGALGAFLKAVGEGLVPRGSLLLVESLDRISRKEARKAVRILEEIVEAGVVVVTLNDGRQYTEESLSGTDFLIAIIILMRAHEESATKAKRLKAAWADKRERAARGEIQTTRVPAWIRTEGSGARSTRNAQLSLIPERSSLIKRMFTMFLDGVGKKGIAEAFNREQIPTWGGGLGRTPAKYWHASYIFKILTNPAVTGRFVPHIENHTGRFTREPQTPIDGYYPRVLDDDTFDRVQTLIKARTRTVRSSSVASLVAGLARCPKCGGTMTRVFKGKKGGPPRLVCTKAKAGAGCRYRAVLLPAVERALKDNAVGFRKPPLADESRAEEIEAAEEALYLVTKQIKALVTAIERTPSMALSKQLGVRESQASKLRAELTALRELAAESESRVVALRAKRAAEALAGADVAVANAALRECVESIIVDYQEGVLRLAWRHGPKTELRFDAGTMFENLDRPSKTRRPV